MDKKFIRYFIEALGTIASVATLIAFVTKWNTDNITLCATVLMVAAITLACCLYCHLSDHA